MQITLLVLAAVMPAMVLLLHFYRRDLNREPGAVVLKTFILGALTTIAVLIVALPMVFLMPLPQSPVVAGLIMAFCWAAIPEEFFKFLVVRFYAARHDHFDEPMDGVVYGVTASLGFAVMENVMYVLQGGWVIAVTRALTAVPAHAFFGAFMGYFVGRSVCGKKGGSLVGLLVATLLHGLYDWPLLASALMISEAIDDPDVGIIAVALHVVTISGLIACAVWSWRIVSTMRAEQVALARTTTPVSPQQPPA